MGNRKYRLNMLNWLKIKNLALIEALEIEFGAGFNVITGETGAGKSILLNTVALLLGERADKSVIRSGADRCELAAGITVGAGARETLSALLEPAGIPFDPESGEIQLRRVIDKAANRNYINDTPVTLQTLKNVGALLVDIHAANDHQSLLNRGTQLEIIDRFGKLGEPAAACRAQYRELTALRIEHEQTFAGLPSAGEAEHLRLMAEEIEKISPALNEDEELRVKHALAANSRTVLELTGRAVMSLRDADKSIADRLGAVYRDLQELCRLDTASAEPLLDTCNQIIEQVRDLAGEIEDYSANIELNERSFQELENRLSALQTLKRRYGPSLERVLQEAEKARARLQVYGEAEQLRREFRQKEEKLTAQLEAAARKLSAARKKAAAELCRQVKTKLKVLGFLQAELDISFSPVEPSERGVDRVELLFSANPGEELQPLRAIASSGEISRVMLALKTVLADADTIPVLIFDEIDVNIGGATAARVGQELLNLASLRQVLCISHLAQVAARGQHHYAVVKNVRSGRTVSTISRLSPDDRIAETARMLGGSEAAAVHARELLKL
ncbi:MAG: DNA repair protein RecN [Victivallaceae bacterium]|nr:DNA repair protein RecN [Victivallaceae bacterium]